MKKIILNIVNILRQGTIEHQIAKIFLEQNITPDQASKFLVSLNVSQPFYTGIRNEMNNITQGVKDERYGFELAAIKKSMRKK